MKKLENRGTYLTAALLILTGIGVALGWVDPSEVGLPGGPVTYENVDDAKGGSDDTTALGLISTLLGLLGIRQRMATAKVQAQLTELLDEKRRSRDDGK